MIFKSIDIFWEHKISTDNRNCIIDWNIVTLYLYTVENVFKGTFVNFYQLMCF